MKCPICMQRCGIQRRLFFSFEVDVRSIEISELTNVLAKCIAGIDENVTTMMRCKEQLAISLDEINDNKIDAASLEAELAVAAAESVQLKKQVITSNEQLSVCRAELAVCKTELADNKQRMAFHNSALKYTNDNMERTRIQAEGHCLRVQKLSKYIKESGPLSAELAAKLDTEQKKFALVTLFFIAYASWTIFYVFQILNIFNRRLNT